MDCGSSGRDQRIHQTKRRVTVNIAYVKNGTPEAGVIYIPVKKELYFADKEFGAYKVSEISSLAEDMTLDKLMAQGVRLPYATGSERPFTIVASRSHLSPETEATSKR